MNTTLLATSVTTSIRLGGTTVDMTSASGIQQLISAAMTNIHYFALTVSLCIFLFAIVRNYTQFGEHVGVRFIATLLVTLVMIFSFPKICDAIKNATYSYSEGTSATIESMFCWLTEQKVNAGKNPGENQSVMQKIAHFPENMLHAIQTAMCNIFYINGIYIGKGIRDIVYFLFQCLYNGAMCLTPIFFGALLIPETRQIGVNFIVTCIGFALMPLCFLFGDLCNIWLAEHMWSFMGLGANGTFWTLGRTGQALLNPVGTVLGYIGFGIFYAAIAAIVYIVLPFLYMKLFRTGSPGSPVGMIASLAGKAANAAIVGGAMAATVATGGATAPATGGAAASAGSSGGAAQAAKNAAKSVQSVTGRAKGASEDISREIDDSANASPGK